MSILLLLTKDAVRQQVTERISLGNGLNNEAIHVPDDLTRLRHDHTRWHRFNVDLLKKLFSDDSVADEYDRRLHVMYAPETFLQSIQSFHDDTEIYLNRLRSIVERTELYEEAPSVSTTSSASIAPGNAVFIVHGHAGREYEVALVISGESLQPIILKEELHGGSPTLIEKLEREASKCGYAVVVVTPDDEGRAMTATDLSPRARQNVILELGFFIAKLGRDRVTILHDPSVTIPSDFGGVAYYPLDIGGAWKGRLAGELGLAGLVDVAKVPGAIDGGTP
jgi:hypothetical protein